MKSMDKNQDETTPRTVIIGIGNLLMKDEGIGIHVIQALQEMDLPPDVEIIDGGTSPDLIAYTRAGDRLIIIDAAKAGTEPGAIYRFKPEDIAAEKSVLVSAHEMGVIETLNMASFTGNKPADVVIIGIEPVVIDWGMELSPLLQQRLPAIVQVVLKEIGQGHNS